MVFTAATTGLLISSPAAERLATRRTLGPGLGIMLTPSVNIVQSSFPEQPQSAITGTVLLADPGGHGPAAAMITLAVIGTIGLIAAAFLPHGRAPTD